MTDDDIVENVDALRAESTSLDWKIANLTEAIENGAAVVPLVAKLTTRQAERDMLLAEIGGADAIGQLKHDRQSIERTVLAHVEGWNRLARRRGRPQTGDRCCAKSSRVRFDLFARVLAIGLKEERRPATACGRRPAHLPGSLRSRTVVAWKCTSRPKRPRN